MRWFATHAAGSARERAIFDRAFGEVVALDAMRVDAAEADAERAGAASNWSIWIPLQFDRPTGGVRR